jgi:hypothetical protein
MTELPNARMHVFAANVNERRRAGLALGWAMGLAAWDWYSKTKGLDRNLITHPSVLAKFGVATPRS